MKFFIRFIIIFIIFYDFCFASPVAKKGVIDLSNWDIYSQDQEDDGKAEIIVSKQRNGPTGKMEASFINKYARFENLSKSDLPF